MKQGKTGLILLLFALILLLVALLDILAGSVRIPPLESIGLLFNNLDPRNEFSVIIHQFRLPKVLTAVLAGTALSASGLQMQTIFRNPLAGPYVLGISAGASLGVAILVMTTAASRLFSLQSGLNNWSVVVAAWLGSGLVLLIILLVSFRIRDVMTILILGILFGSITIAIVSILQYFSDEAMLKTFVVWTLGSLGNVDKDQLLIMGICVIAGLLLLIINMKNLDAFLIGEDYARSMGIRVMQTRILVFTSTSLLAGTVTAFCGPIGFVGIIVPHVARIIFRTARHAVIIPGSVLIGSGIILVADIIAQMPGLDIIIPINSVTALLGIPVVIWIILKNKHFYAV